MSVAAMLPPSLLKEVRALAAPWLGCVACMLSIAISDSPRLFGPLALIAYLVGTVALGALSFGHEYTGRTLGLLLTLPARRERLFATKFGVLTGMLLALWLVGEKLVFSAIPAPADVKQVISLVTVLCALFLAPWLTMACRSSIAGTVFALTIPGVLGLVGEQLGLAQDGQWIRFMWFGTLGLCAVSGVMSWRTFMRLEAIEGGSDGVRMPRWLRLRADSGRVASHLTRRNPVWLLVTKELRLQQMPFVLAAIYSLIWIIAASSPRWVTDSAYLYALGTGTILYASMLSMLIGSSASAGERQIGTLDWQVLLPIAAWKQWAVKVGVVLALTLTLAIGLPVVLTALSRSLRESTVSFGQIEAPIIAVMLLASGSLYVSSLCRSGLSALLMSIPAVVASQLFVQLAGGPVGTATYFAVRQLTGSPMPRYRYMYFLAPRALSYLLIAGVIAIALRFAFSNHRFADRPAKRVWTQVSLMAIFVAAGIIAGNVWQALRH